MDKGMQAALDLVVAELGALLGCPLRFPLDELEDSVAEAVSPLCLKAAVAYKVDASDVVELLDEKFYGWEPTTYDNIRTRAREILEEQDDEMDADDIAAVLRREFMDVGDMSWDLLYWNSLRAVRDAIRARRAG